MTRSILFLTAFTLIPAAWGTTPAQAQAVQFGPPPAGICLLGREAALAGSRAGQGASVQIRQIIAGVMAELNPQRLAIQQESAALRGGQATLPAAQLQQRLGQLQQRAEAFERLDQLRGAQIQQTRVRAEQQIMQALQPALGPVVTARKCAVVFERTTTYGWNNAMDVTPQVIQEIDRRLPAITIRLATPESLSAQGRP